MKLAIALLAAASLTFAAAPVITELQPRGAQKGRPFTLKIAGTNIGEGATVVSTLPATFTPLAGSTAFLVEPTSEWSVGVYPVRIRAANGISNILLFSIGAFPEITEEESRHGALPHQNDSIENAQSLPSTPVTLNGTLSGPERDVYRIQAKAGEKRVFEIDARRCGSAVDPVIRVLDGAGKLIARSDDDPLLSLDPRVVVTFPREGYYYVEIHDARFSTQAQNFYRLKTGAYTAIDEIYPLGGRRGEQVEVSLSGTKVKVDLAKITAPQTFVNLPDSPSLPLPFAIGEYPEVYEPVQGPLQLPVTINGRLSAPGEVDSWDLDVKPGEEFIFAVQARELGISKLMGLITIYDEKGHRLASAGDQPLPVDVAAVQVSSRTQGDPSLPFTVPPGVNKIRIALEDLAQRGGKQYAYRLTAYRSGFDIKPTVTTPYVNVPVGGAALVTINVERQGYMGPIRIAPKNLPPGITAAGGDIPAEVPDPNNRAVSRRAVLTLAAEPGAKLAEPLELQFEAVAGDLHRGARGLGFAIGVNGATEQGVVDRQRPLTGAWLGYQLPAALTDPGPATLALRLENTAKKEAGYEFRFRWKWTPRGMARVPEALSVDVPNFTDLRVIEMKVDDNDRTTGTFLVTSTRNTLPALYDILASGRMMADGVQQDIYAPVLTFTLPALDPEEKPANAPSAAAAR